MDARRVGWIAVAGLLIGTSPARANHGHHHHHHHHHRGFHRGFFPGFFAPGFRYYRAYGYAYGIVPYYYGYGGIYNFNLNLNLNQNFYAPPPARVPAGRPARPRAAQNAGGMNAALRAHAAGRAAARANAQPPLILRGDDEPEPEQLGDAPDRRDANAKSLARARRFIEFGDAKFRAQHYRAALARYQSARDAAPTLAEVYFRQGFAYTALGQYDAAARAFERGLELDPNRPQSDFDLSELFGDDPAPLIASRRRVASAAAGDPENSDLLFVLGVQLYFAGQRDRALAFFQKIQQLSPDDARLDPFLIPPGEPFE